MGQVAEIQHQQRGMEVLTIEQLAAIKEQKVIEAFTTPGGLTPLLDHLDVAVAEFQHDTSTKASRQRTISFAAKIGKLSKKVQDAKKQITAEWKAKAKVVDTEARNASRHIQEKRAEARKPVTDWEESEEMRVAVINNKMDQIKSLSVVYDEHGDTLCIHTLAANLRLLNSYTVNKEMFGEFERAAKQLKESNIAALEEFVEHEKQRIAQELKIKQLQAEKEKREKKAYEDELKRNAAEYERKKNEREERERTAKIELKKQKAEEEAVDAKRKAADADRRAKDAEKHAKEVERKAKAAEKQAEQERLEAVEQAVQDQIKQGEEEEARKQEAHDKLVADRNYVAGIKAAASAGLMSRFFLPSDLADEIVEAIANEEIDNLRVIY